jgi:hypothetical protein
MAIAAPELVFGFTYKHDGKTFATCIIAASQKEAEARLTSMTKAVCVGEWCPADSLPPTRAVCESVSSSVGSALHAP